MTDDHNKYISERIEELRSRLLDLSNRSPLLNFRHSVRSKAHIRVIDELPDVLFKKIVEGKKLSFHPLPEPKEVEDDPTDERTEEFLFHYSVAQQTDEQYLRELEQLDEQDDENEDLHTVDRRLRDRLREKLEMPPLYRNITPTNAELAELANIDSSYELPDHADDEEIIFKHKDNKVQTLLRRDEMRAKLANLNRAIIEDLNEAGVNTLYVAFGFLCHYDSESSDEPRYAPLMLLQLKPFERAKIDKKLGGEEKYTFTGDGGSPQWNIALAEKLKGQHGIELPEIDENDTPDTYIKKVEKVIAKMHRWKVCRYVTIGKFSFTGHFMYNDLMSSEWGKIGGLANSQTIKELISGLRERQERDYINDAPEYDIDKDPVVRQNAPILVRDADSSQHSAIVDVMSGNNVAIIGPPGTGKSQTIVNIIANAIYDGKRVLFVSEKKAALDVVYNRLKDTGLGEFCLPMHSARTTVNDLRQDLSNAYEGRKKRNGSSKKLESCKEQLSKLQSSIRHYAESINSVYGELEETIYEQIWKQIKQMPIEENLPMSLRRVSIRNVCNISPYMLSEYLVELGKVEKLDKEVRRFLPGDHPWHGVCATESNDCTAINVFDQFEQCYLLLERLQRKQMELLNVPLSKKIDSVHAAKALAKSASEFLQLNLRTLNFKLLSGNLQSAECFAASKTLCEVWKVQQNIVKASKSIINDVDEAISRKGEITKHIALATKCEALTETKLEIEKRMKSLEAKLKVYEEQKEKLLWYGSEVFGAQGEALNVEQYVLLGKIANYTISAEEAEYDANGIARDLGSARKCVQEVELEAEKLRKTNSSLSKHFSQDALSGSATVDELIEMVEVMTTGSIFSVFSRKYWRAKRLLQEVCIDLKSNRNARSVLQNAEKLLKYRQNVEQLESDEIMLRLFGNNHQGVGTNFEKIYTVMNWIEDVEKDFGNNSGSTALAKEYLYSKAIKSDESRNMMSALANVINYLDSSTVLEQSGQAQDVAIGDIVGEITKKNHDLGVLLRELERTIAEEDVTYQSIADWLETTACEYVQHKETLQENIAKIGTHCGEVGADEGVVVGELRDVFLVIDFLESIEYGEWQNDGETAEGMYIHLHTLQGKHREYQSLIEQVDEQLRNAMTLGTVDTLAYFGVSEYEAALVESMMNKIKVSLGEKSALHEKMQLATIVKKSKDENKHYYPVLQCLDDEGMTYDNVADIFVYLYYLNMCKETTRTGALSSTNSIQSRDELHKRFRELDKRYIQLNCEEVAQKLRKVVPTSGVSEGRVRDFTQMGLIHHHVKNERARPIPIRKFISRAGKALQELTPCFLMSPMSVSKYLEPGEIEFDLVVIDEASQMPLEDAIGSIGRAKQAVVVGDQKQLPPTSFFKGGRGNDMDYDQEEDDRNVSTLDVALVKYSPARNLRWHYRSRHESLIAFSNRHFYGDKLIVHPSPEKRREGLGVSSVFVKGTYQAGCNPKEVDAVQMAARRHMTIYPERSLGIVTMNVQQRQLIDESIDRLLRQDDNCAKYWEKWSDTLEPFFVKNLENVQGDERDTMIISTVYGPDSNGNVMQRFGPINGKHGHRRLNVLFTRAKQCLEVYTSLRSSDIRVSEASTLGLKAFRDYLKYAVDGKLEMGEETEREPDNIHEIRIMEELKNRGYGTVPQVGVAGYFIDIGVLHPEWPNGYILGVEFDGATYHSLRSVRDNDRLRQEVLEGHGWVIHRIWSTDWFNDYKKEMSRLVDKIEETYGKKKQTLYVHRMRETNTMSDRFIADMGSDDIGSNGFDVEDGDRNENGGYTGDDNNSDEEGEDW